MKNIYYAFYGSLRNDGYNAERMKRLFGNENYKLIKKVTVKGWKLYDTQWGYPAITTSDDPNSEVVMEIFDVSNRIAEYVQAMELGAGYTEASTIIEGEHCIVYVYDEIPNHFIEVPTGDWIDYLKQNNEISLKKY